MKRNEVLCDFEGRSGECRARQVLAIGQPCASLGGVRAAPVAGEQPKHDSAGEHFDQAVGAEADSRDRAGGEPGGDRELDDVPADPAPGKQPRTLLEIRSFGRCRSTRQHGNRQRARLGELQQRCVRLRHERVSCVSRLGLGLRERKRATSVPRR